MPQAIETVFGAYAAVASTGLQPYTPANGQSFSVRACNGATPAHLGALWSNSADVGFPRIRSPRLHDDVNGLQTLRSVSDPSPLLDGSMLNTLFSQDALTVEDLFLAAPTVTDVQTIAFNVYYDDLPGISANMMTWAQVKSLVAAAPIPNQWMGVFVEPETSASVAQFGAGAALNSSQDVFKANSLYALIGYEVDTDFTGFAIQGSDIGNLLYGGPGTTDAKITRNWFVEQEMITGLPSIPVINSQNKQATNIFAFDVVPSTTYSVNLIFAYCGPATT